MSGILQHQLASIVNSFPNMQGLYFSLEPIINLDKSLGRHIVSIFVKSVSDICRLFKAVLSEKSKVTSSVNAVQP